MYANVSTDMSVSLEWTVTGIIVGQDGLESSQSWPKIKIAECDLFFRSLEKENSLKYMIISIFNF